MDIRRGCAGSRVLQPRNETARPEAVVNEYPARGMNGKYIFARGSNER
jgi:hypothetical protein